LAASFGQLNQKDKLNGLSLRCKVQAGIIPLQSARLEKVRNSWRALVKIGIHLLASILLFRAALPVAVAQTLSTPSSGPSQSGVAIEKVNRDFEGDKAGLQKGDIVLRWSRGESQGELGSPFDLMAVEIEQAPRGTVLLHGLRGNQHKVWSLGQDYWGLQGRFSFAGAEILFYNEAQALATSGRLSEAAEKFRALAALPGTSHSPLRDTWLLFHLAQVEAEERSWSASDQTYRESVERATASPGIQEQLMRAWAKTFEQRSSWEQAEANYRQAAELDRSTSNDFGRAMDIDGLARVARSRGEATKAEEYCRQALKIRQELAPGSLAVAMSLNSLGDLEEERGNLVQAEDSDRQALVIGEKLAPRGLHVSGSLMGLGFVAWDRSDFVRAEAYFQQALAIRERLVPGSLDVATSLNGLGKVADRRDDEAKAENYYRQALAIRERLAPESLDVASSLHNLAGAADHRGDSAQAWEYYLRALAIRERLAPGSLVLSYTLNNLGNLSGDRGDLAKAEEYYQRALEIRQRLAPGSPAVAMTLGNLGVMARDRGDLVEAEEYYRKALEIRQRVTPGGLDVALIFNNLGNLNMDRGDLAKAESYYRRALDIRERIAPGSLAVAVSWGGLGQVAEERDDLKKAAEYYRRALEIKEHLAPGSLYAARTLGSLGDLYRRQGDFSKAEEHLRRALAIEEKTTPFGADTAFTLERLGEVRRDQRDPGEAEHLCRRALRIFEQLSPLSADHAESLALLASILRGQNQWDEASQVYAQALHALEGQASRLGGSADVRADFRARHQDYYREYIDLLLSQGKGEVAFEILERSRARTLLETLAAARVDIRRGVDPGLIRKERSLQVELKAKSEWRVQLLSEQKNEDQVKAVEKEISALTGEYQDVQAQIRLNSPVYSALTQPQPLSAGQIQEQLLDAGTLLVEYSLGEERSHVFAVSANSLQAFELPKRAVIEAASRHVYELLTARNHHDSREKPAERATRIARADAAYPLAAAHLSRMVLGPLAGKLALKRLLIVSDGALHYVPFAALPVPAGGKSQAPLAARHEIVYLPSASVLAVLRRAQMGRQRAVKTVAVLADPVFDSRDVRVQHPGLSEPPAASQVRSGAGEVPAAATGEKGQAQPGSEFAPGEESLEREQLTRSMADMGEGRGGGLYLPRLQFTRREAEEIVSVTPAGKTFKAVDFDANRATATSSDLASYRFVHFATHALLNSKHPELSGLVLSLVDDRGRPQSGFLGLEDIYNLNLPAELVVLSACETALGKGVEGEGMVGLTRGFMYAGASRVMASLWNIDDRATADQMKYFYRAMVGQGMRPAAALRAAELKMREDPRWRAPYFWAAFQIQGEWK
jgi:CHAT domain-containing protein/tetratricopeptide (TPR) repeat protein